MMYSFTCPDHGRLVVDLALGRLDSADSERADDVSRRCPDCSSWWRREIGDASAAVDVGVAEAFAAFVPPVASRRPVWLRLAAVAVVVLACGLGWELRHASSGSQPTSSESLIVVGQVGPIPDVNRDGRQDASDILAALQAEKPSTERPVSRDIPTVVKDGSTLHGDGMETGSLSGWSSHT